MSFRILYNAQIYTLDQVTPVVSALAIDNGRIMAAGDDNQIRSQFGSPKSSKNLGGHTVIPGLTDAHIHLKNYALGLQKIDCEVTTKDECLRRVAECVHTTPAGNWILGHGWNQNEWSGGFGTAADLDAVAPGHPVYLTAKSLHSSWVNTEALKKAGINASTPDPADGQIQRDLRGDPTGILLEGAAALVSAVIPQPSLTDVMDAILLAQNELLAMGITGIHDFDRQVCFTALQNLHFDEKLKLRVTKSIPLESLPHAVELGLRSGFGDDLLRIGGIKMFSDGALGPHTAAMFQPYENSPGDRGMLLMDAEEIYERGLVAVENGLSLAIHAIGDRANHEVLNAFERLRCHETRLRHRIEHVQLLHPDDLGRLSQLGVIASMQPIHATSDMLMADAYWGDRSTYSYAWRSQLDHGAMLAFGSDAPVESPNPFWGIHAAVTRRRADGSPGFEGWYPKQKLSIEEAIKPYTLGAAFAAGMEDRLGKLVPGYWADLLVLDMDPFTCDPDEIQNILPTATMIAGEWVTNNLE